MIRGSRSKGDKDLQELSKSAPAAGLWPVGPEVDKRDWRRFPHLRKRMPGYNPLSMKSEMRTPGFPAIGDIVADRFLLTRQAGAGGMGVVFAAQDLVSREDEGVATKFTEDTECLLVSGEACVARPTEHDTECGQPTHPC